MPKTPDDVKKGLEVCGLENEDCNSVGRCPYETEFCNHGRKLVDDVLAYIRQLESDKQQLEGLLHHMNQLRDAAAGRALKMEERVHQLEAERDAAVADLTEMAGHLAGDTACEWCDKTECELGCMDADNNEGFKWRGVQKEE